MDEFGAAGFDEYECEQLRKIVEDTGIEPERLICVIRNSNENTELFTDHGCIDPFEQLAEAWDNFKAAFLEVFVDSKIGRFMFGLADKLVAFLERKKE